MTVSDGKLRYNELSLNSAFRRGVAGNTIVTTKNLSIFSLALRSPQHTAAETLTVDVATKAPDQRFVPILQSSMRHVVPINSAMNIRTNTKLSHFRPPALAHATPAVTKTVCHRFWHVSRPERETSRTNLNQNHDHRYHPHLTTWVGFRSSQRWQATPTN